MYAHTHTHVHAYTHQGGKEALPQLPPDFQTPQVVGRNQRARVGMRVQANGNYWQRLNRERARQAPMNNAALMVCGT